MDTVAGDLECDMLGLSPVWAPGRDRFCVPFGGGGPGGGSGPGCDAAYAPGDGYGMYDACAGYGEGSGRTGPPGVWPPGGIGIHIG
jgi:hypothetical protein